MNFVPKGQEIPKPPSEFFTPEDGDSKVRILDESMAGWKWQDAKTDEWKFSKEKPKVKVGDVKQWQKGGSTLQFFIAVPVWSYEDEEVRIWSITQTSIMDSIETMANNSDWGDVTKYDLTITKSGSGLETRYSVLGNPNKGDPNPEWLAELEEKRKEEKENGGHKFRCKWDTPTETPPAASTDAQEESTKVDDLPF